MNLLTACLVQGDGLWITIDNEARLRVPDALYQRYRQYLGAEVTFGIRPEDIRASSEHIAPGHWAKVKVPIRVVEDLGKEALVYFRIGKQAAIASVGSGAVAHGQETVELIFNMDKMHLFDKSTGQTIR